MKPVTFLPEITPAEVASVFLPENKVTAYAAGFGFVVIGLGILALVKVWGGEEVPLFAYAIGFVWFFAGYRLLSKIIKRHREMDRIYVGIVRMTTSRGLVTLSDEGVRYFKDGVVVNLPWQDVGVHKVTGDAILFISKSGEPFLLSTSQLVELRALVDVSCLLSANSPVEDSDEFAWASDSS